MNRTQLQAYINTTYYNNNNQAISGLTLAQGMSNILGSVFTQDESYSETEVNALLTGVSYANSSYTLDRYNAATGYTDSHTPDLSGYYTSAQTNQNFLSASTSLDFATHQEVIDGDVSGISYIKSLGYITGATIDAYTKTESNQNFLSASTNLAQYSLTSHTHGQYQITGLSYLKAEVYNTGETYTKGQVDNLLTGVTIDMSAYWTSAITNQQDSNVLQSAYTYTLQHSGSTIDLSAYYTSSQTNSNFLSANTTLYTKIEAESSFLSANTFIPSDFYSRSESNSNFLSANTSLYNRSQSDLYYLNTGETGNWLSANTSLLTKALTDTYYLNTGQSYLSAYTGLMSNDSFMIWSGGKAYTNQNMTFGTYGIYTGIKINDRLILGSSGGPIDYFSCTEDITPDIINVTDDAFVAASVHGVKAYVAANFLSASTVLYTALSALTDTTISTPTGGQILLYDEPTSKWINSNLTGATLTSTIEFFYIPT
jgi:hypothetical protein